MAPKSIKTEICHILTELRGKDFEKFCFHLTDSSEEPRIRAGEVEGKSREDITTLLVSRCTGAGALHRTITTLRHIGCNEEAQELECRNTSRLDVRSQGVMDAPLNKKKHRDPEQPAEPLSVWANGVTSAKMTRAKQTQSKVEKSSTDEPKLSGDLLLFGKHRGKSFEWLLQKYEAYAVYVVATHLKEREDGDTTQTELMRNKDALAEYVSCFPNVMEEVHFYREGLAPLGFGKYEKVTRQDLYNSEDEMEKRYMKWLRSLEGTGNGAHMERVLKYISHRDAKGGTCPCSSFKHKPTRRSPRRGEQSGTRFIPVVKKQWL
ncbi:uncharacterized protein LOC117384271 [Periophthalmus magnuspinnatus]|uniref:uncharacterized protein LOC117384271 n=1 Tax=Periophthalmus magnuspinnatus TaxID=409849 RepID=UPI00145BE41F|nr:uncharacterized protein LOC117384271 [Periophthalmus magnuspinnatus]